MERIYILGLGALGGMYASKLKDNGIPVRIIASRERAEKLAHSGISVNGKSYHFDFLVPGDPVPPADLLLVAVKSHHLPEAIREMKPFIGKDTVIISLLNGITSEEIIGAEVGMEHLLYAFALGMDVGRIGTEIRYINMGRIVFGEAKNTTLSPRVAAVKELFERAQVPHRIPEDMLRAQWSKFMMNVGVNQVSAILRGTYGMFRQNQDARELMLSAFREVIALSQPSGVALNDADIQEILNILDSLSEGGKTSMLQDIEAGRKTEVDIFGGVVIEMGKKLGILTPVNEALVHIIRVLEERV